MAGMMRNISYFKVLVMLYKAYRKVLVILHKLPFSASIRMVLDVHHTDIFMVLHDANLKIFVVGDYPHAAVERNIFTLAVLNGSTGKKTDKNKRYYNTI
jgi:hypothetical protein